MNSFFVECISVYFSKIVPFLLERAHRFQMTNFGNEFMNDKTKVSKI